MSQNNQNETSLEKKLAKHLPPTRSRKKQSEPKLNPCARDIASHRCRPMNII